MYGRGFGFLTFAILLVILIAECVASKGSFSGVRRIVVLLILISSAVFATAQFRYASVDENRDSYMQYMTDEKSVIVWGKIYKTEYKYFSYRYYMTDCVVQPGYGKAFGRKISCGDVVVYCDSKSAHLGDYMKACGKIGLFKSATNEGEFDRARFYRSQGIDFSVNADSIKTSAGKHAWYYHGLEKLRDTLSASLLEVTDETTAGVLSSMLLGDKSYLDDEIKDLYRVSGISHILAISGLHISIVGMAFYKLLRKRRVSYTAAFVCSAALILSYAVMTGNAVSTRRAVGMFILTMLAAALGRCTDMLNSLGIMVIYLLWDNPMVLGYAGFVFSVGAILAIGILTDDNAKINEALNYYKYLGSGSGFYLNGHSDPDSSEMLGQCQESGRDQGHTALCVGMLAIFCKMAANVGEDLLAYDNYRALSMFEYYAKYNVGESEAPGTDNKGWVMQGFKYAASQVPYETLEKCTNTNTNAKWPELSYEEKQNGNAVTETVEIAAWTPANVNLISNYPTVKLDEGTSLFTDLSGKIEAKWRDRQVFR